MKKFLMLAVVALAVLPACVAMAEPGDAGSRNASIGTGLAVIGAGATGTELAAELHRTAREVVAYGLDRIDPHHDIRILLIEAAERILPGLPERISKAAHQLLDGMGVEVRTSARVADVRADGVLLLDGSFIPSELVVWAAGVKAPELLRHLDGLRLRHVALVIFAIANDDDGFSHWSIIAIFQKLLFAGAVDSVVKRGPTTVM